MQAWLVMQLGKDRRREFTLDPAVKAFAEQVQSAAPLRLAHHQQNLSIARSAPLRRSHELQRAWLCRDMHEACRAEIQNKHERVACVSLFATVPPLHVQRL